MSLPRRPHSIRADLVLQFALVATASLTLLAVFALFLNLVINALDARKGRGRVAVRTWVVEGWNTVGFECR